MRSQSKVLDDKEMRIVEELDVKGLMRRLEANVMSRINNKDIREREM